MKHVYFPKQAPVWSLVLLLVGFGLPNLHGQCAFDFSPFSSSSAPTSPGVTTLLTSCLYGGEHRPVTNMQAGSTYRFETCGDSDFDTQITIFNETGTTALAFNDDFCGLQSSVEFTPITSGTYLVQVNEFDCASNSTCMTLRATLLSADCNENEVVVEMFDSFGDGWNGNDLDILDENNSVVGTATIASGSSGTETFCLPDGCYTVDVDGGSFQSEVSWEISVNGTPALSGGAPASGLELAINSTCGGPPPVSCNDNAFTLVLNLDSFADETAWEVRDEDNNVVASATYSSSDDGDTVTEPICLPDGCYELFITDDFGDGIFGTGDFVFLDGQGNTVASGEVSLSGGLQASFDAGSGCAPPTPENTTCANAEPATLGVNETETVNVGDGAENGCSFPISSGSADHARWFTFTPAQTGEYTIGSSGFTSADTRLSIYTGNCGSLSCFASNDDINGLADQASEVTTCLQAGVTYYIEWDDRWSIASFDWSISYNGTGDCGTGGDLPAPWTANDIGSGANDFGFDNGAFTVVSGGSNGYSNSNDNTAFASQTICGNGSITVKIESVSGSGFAGVALRESTAPGAKQAMILTNLNSLVPWVTRTANNAPNNFTPHWRAHTFWLKLERIGNYIRGYASTTGNSFSLVAQTYLPMDACVEIGMITANTGGGQTAATFSNVTVEGGAPLLAADETATHAETDREKSAVSGELRGFEQPAAIEAARLFPNPASDRITIDLPATQPMEATLVLRNQLGQVLQSRQVEAGLFRTDWDVSQLSGGVYYMEVRYEGQQPQVLRFVKTH
jgi:regulation of enolase protein 1 (concanavalin A-like superfamily)